VPEAEGANKDMEEEGQTRIEEGRQDKRADTGVCPYGVKTRRG